MGTHEDKLLAVLERIGQPGATDSPPFPAIEDADSNADSTETTGGRESDFEEPPSSMGPGLPEGTTPITKKNLFVHHDTHPVVFDVALLAQYDLDWILWLPQTLWQEVKRDFHVPSISDHTRAKIQALRTIHINEWFWTRWEVFCWITQALNNNMPDFQVIQKPSVAQIMNAVDIADMVRSGEEFSQEVQGWVASCLVDEGVFYAPKPIAFCQDEIVQLLQVLKVDNVENLIASVQERFREIQSLSAEAWAAAKGPILQETAVDIQVAKLKVASGYLSMRRDQLKQQLRLLQ